MTRLHTNLTASDFIRKSFDFLIVGGGTAGLVVAARLSENPHLTVGVLEAGSCALGKDKDEEGEDEDDVNIPGYYRQTLGGSRDWQFETIPQQGLGSGGTSALNFMTWNRGSRQDYDAWMELGNQGWGWDDLLPFFKKSETFHKPNQDVRTGAKANFDLEAVGSNGPIQISFPQEYSASHSLWHHTLNSLCVETNVAHLSGSNVGVWTSACSVEPEARTRSYSASAYYLPNASWSNLILLTEAVVVNILLDQENGAWVAKGIILSAGSVQSPQIIELSGIASTPVLSMAGISVKVDSPNVGENLQDHLMTTTVFEVNPSLENPDDLKTDMKLASSARYKYVNTKSGPLTILRCSICYLPLSHFVSPDILSSLTSLPPSIDHFSEQESFIFRRLSHSEKLGHIEYIFDLGNWSSFFKPNPSEGKKYGTMLQILQYPLSKGSIHIHPPDSAPTRPSTITDKLAIDPKYYAGRNGHLDLEIMTQCQRFAQKICSTKPLADIIRARAFPPPSVSDDELQEWIVQTTVTDWHPVGTCSMGGRGRVNTGVVDERLRVHGVRGPRVVDASIMPLQISAHLQATVYAIAEKAAHMILQDIGGYGE
ncbi:putative choline dehydrogenase [Amylocarpus encephaloides]|uniref:Choline dehydrogenase n=1 Tax=Amylocarpus encephaloides TaxID=45428 RepID=A0A9P7YDB7_9HELO|nr:putative choline dehydrogenase [Amylocarpus encephaloides]